MKRCWLFFHDWRLKATDVFKLYDGDEYENRLPIHIETKFLYQCEKCTKVKVKKLEGGWVRGKDDDDDDDGDKTPPMSPDDFYDSLEKEDASR